MIYLHPLVCLVTAMLWAVAALFVLRLPARRRGPALWGLVIVGVPMLGWLTLCWGPFAGLAVFLLGALLVARPFRQLLDN